MIERSGARSLYLCYLGLREPLVQTQVLPYLRELVRGGAEVRLITFEPASPRSWSKQEEAELRAQLNTDRIDWQTLRYHKRPSLPATLFDIWVGGLVASKLIRLHKIDVVHARGHIAAAMALIAKRIAGARFIFDIRGFIPEEYVDGGVWPEDGLNYRLAKRAEKWCLDAADGFVVLTSRARDILFGTQPPRGSDRPVEVIPCCVDFDRFDSPAVASREEVRDSLGLKDRRVLVYVGNVGGWYLTDELVQFLRVAHEQDPSTFSLILTQGDCGMIADRLTAVGIEKHDFMVKNVVPSEIPAYLRAADLALSFIKPCYSKLASSPTKFAEYLAAGLPVICNSGVGDVDEIIEADRIGVVIREFSRDACLDALRQAAELALDPKFSERCRGSARRRFDLNTVGGVLYRRLYEKVINSGNESLTASRAA
jgi:glycosyltransferase involved in cell wall biosynthesis